jgi:hypothetical protein
VLGGQDRENAQPCLAPASAELVLLNATNRKEALILAVPHFGMGKVERTAMACKTFSLGKSN